MATQINTTSKTHNRSPLTQALKSFCYPGRWGATFVLEHVHQRDHARIAALFDAGL